MNISKENILQYKDQYFNILVLVLTCSFTFFLFVNRSSSKLAFYLLCVLGVITFFSSINLSRNTSSSNRSKQSVLKLLSLLILGVVVVLHCFDVGISISKFLIFILLALMIWKEDNIESSMLIFAVVLWVGIEFVSYYHARTASWGSALFDGRYFKPLFFIPLLYLYRNVAPSLIPFIAANFIIFGIAILDRYFRDFSNLLIYHAEYALGHTASGSDNQVNFAMGSLWFALSTIPFLLTERRKIIIFLLFVAMICGSIALLFAESRGVWIAVPGCFVAGLIILKRIRIRTKLMSLVFFIFACLFIIQIDFVKNRLANAFSDIQQYRNNTSYSDPSRSTSPGVRLEMWKISWDMYKEHPVLGVGSGNYQEYTKQKITENIYHSAVSEYGHPHSIYMRTLSTKGTFGILSLVIMIGLFFRFFILRVSHSNNLVANYSLLGILLLSSLLIAGLTESQLNNKALMNLFFLYMAFLCGSILGNHPKSS